jgi:type III restriction enzyme
MLAQAAQLVFSFNDDIDPRLFRSYLVDRFKRTIEAKGGQSPSESELRRAIDQIAVYQPNRIRDAMRRAQSRHVRIVQADPLPSAIVDIDGLFDAKRGAYGVFPSQLNGPERRFAEYIDDLSGVKWWLRNPDHPRCKWSVKVVMSNGRGFYPDFIIGIAGRRTPDEVRLAEVKDSGETGRLQADLNLTKIRTRHRAYLDVLWVNEDEEGSGSFWRLEFSAERNRIIRIGTIDVDALRGD